MVSGEGRTCGEDYNDSPYQCYQGLIVINKSKQMLFASKLEHHCCDCC